MNLNQLTPREQEIYGLIIRGWSNQEIACHLYLSRRTVETIASEIYSKTGQRRYDLIRQAISQSNFIYSN